MFLSCFIVTVSCLLNIEQLDACIHSVHCFEMVRLVWKFIIFCSYGILWHADFHVLTVLQMIPSVICQHPNAEVEACVVGVCKCSCLKCAKRRSRASKKDGF